MKTTLANALDAAVTQNQADQHERHIRIAEEAIADFWSADALKALTITPADNGWLQVTTDSAAYYIRAWHDFVYDVQYAFITFNTRTPKYRPHADKVGFIERFTRVKGNDAMNNLAGR